MDIEKLKQTNDLRWKAMKIRPERLASIDKTALRLVGLQSRYRPIAKAVWSDEERWPIVGVIHDRESGCDFGCNLAQGDHWDRKSIYVPAGEGPFGSFDEAAVHALVRDDCASARLRLIGDPADSLRRNRSGAFPALSIAPHAFPGPPGV